MKKKNQKRQKSSGKQIAAPAINLSEKVEQASSAFARSIEALLKQALQEHIRAATADLVGRNATTESARSSGKLPLPVGGGALASGKKAKKSKKSKKSNDSADPNKARVSSFDDSELEAKVLAFLDANPASRVEALTKALKAEPEAVRRVVARLFEQKKVTRRGKTRGTKYSLATQG
jgi:hypothetical protein